MSTPEFKKAVRLARSGDDLDFTQEDYNAMIGFGCRDFKPVQVSLHAVAAMLRYQCCQYNGGWDHATEANDKPYYIRSISLL